MRRPYSTTSSPVSSPANANSITPPLCFRLRHNRCYLELANSSRSRVLASSASLKLPRWNARHSSRRTAAIFGSNDRRLRPLKAGNRSSVPVFIANFLRRTTGTRSCMLPPGTLTVQRLGDHVSTRLGNKDFIVVRLSASVMLSTSWSKGGGAATRNLSALLAQRTCGPGQDRSKFGQRALAHSHHQAIGANVLRSF